MNRLVALAGLIALVVTGCAVPPAPEGKVRVGVVLKTSNEFFSAVIDGIEAMPKEDIELLGIEAQGDGTEAQSQINAIQNLVTRGADALVIAPVGPQVRPTLRQVVQQGVKVVITDNEFPDFPEQTSYVGPDGRADGELAGRYLAEQLDGAGKVAVMSGIPGVPALDDRVTGMLDGLKGTDIEVVTTLATDCDQTKGLNVMEAIGSAHPDVDAVYAACGPPILGGIQALRKNDPFTGDPLLVGYDGLPDEARAILRGDETATVAQFPRTMGEKAVRTAADAALGREVPRRLVIPGQLITKDEAERFTTFQ